MAFSYPVPLKVTISGNRLSCDPTRSRGLFKGLLFEMRSFYTVTEGAHSGIPQAEIRELCLQAKVT